MPFEPSMLPRFLVLTLSLLLACRSAERPRPGGLSTSATVSIEQFQSLRWLEGDWRGAEAGGSPFFERYRFLDDSTLRQHTFGDSTLARITDSGTTALRSSRVIAGERDPMWHVTSLDSVSWHFASLRDADRGFTWRREAADTWTATLTWRDAQGTLRERTYTLVRMTR